MLQLYIYIAAIGDEGIDGHEVILSTGLNKDFLYSSLNRNHERNIKMNLKLFAHVVCAAAYM